MLMGIESNRGGQPVAVKIVPKKKGKSHRGDDNEDRQKYVPYILPEDHKINKDYTIIDLGDMKDKIGPVVPEQSSSFFGHTEADAIAEQNANTSDGTPEEQVSPDGTPSTNNNTQEQQLSTDRGGSTNDIP
jgi:hypothetical protein